MALYTYNGPYNEVEVRVAGEFVGVVEKDGSLSVPDELAAKAEWSEHWTKQEDAAPDSIEEVPATENEGNE